MKKSWKRRIVIRIKKTISKIVLFFLYKGFKVVGKEDETVKKEIEAWREGFTVIINTGIKDVNLVMKKEKGKLIRIKEASQSDIEITFKSIDVAFLIFTGRLGISKAYAEHRFTLKGEIGKAMSFVRCTDIVEAYLFPKFITKNILKTIPKKSMGLVKCYTKILGTK